MLAASSTDSDPRKRGSSPSAAEPQDTSLTNSPAMNPMVMMSSSPITTNSKGRWPCRDCTDSSSIDTTPTITPPHSSGMPNRMWSAIAPPMTSARSVAAATSSACSQNAIRGPRRNRPPSSSGRL